MPWVRLTFSATRLAPGSELRITSLSDGEMQRFDGTQLARWSNTTAFFNGSSVRVDLIAGPKTTGNLIRMDQLIAGEAPDARSGRRFTPESIGEVLATRDLMKSLRESGMQTGGPKPYGPNDRSQFLQRLDQEVHAARKSRKLGGPRA